MSFVPSRTPVVPVACGCIVNARGEVLICQRPAGKIAAGKWEFPGGKIEAGETPLAALQRELREELGITVQTARPLIEVRHAYSDRTVILHTWRVSAFSGAMHPHDGQGLAWVMPAGLSRWDLLAADVPIVTALRLPAHYVFTPPAAAEAQILAGLPGLPAGALLRLRLPALSDAQYAGIAAQLLPACRTRGLVLMLDRAPAMVQELGAQGWHASAAALAGLESRAIPPGLWMAASCHDAQELRHARNGGADFAVLGPVRKTATHPGQKPLGWEGFAGLARSCGLPVFGIGGVCAVDAATAWDQGGQGVAGISAWWATAG